MPSSNGTQTCQELADFFNERNAQLQKYLFWHVRSREIAEELAQETYVRFLRQPETRQVIDLNAFLFTVAANLARDYLRSSARRHRIQEPLPLDPELPDTGPSPEEIVASQHLGEQLEKAINTLPAKTREIFLMYKADGLRYREIAEHLGISERTVEYHIRQAALHCRSYLTGAGASVK